VSYKNLIAENFESEFKKSNSNHDTELPMFKSKTLKMVETVCRRVMW
jgi:hypothetical protein